MLACPRSGNGSSAESSTRVTTELTAISQNTGNKAALIFAPEPEDEGYQAITYQDLTPSVFGGTPAVFGGGNQRLHSASVR